MLLHNSFLKIIIPVFLQALLMLAIFEPVFSQTDEVKTIAGQIIDKNTGEPVYLANVYISNTSLGTTSDAEGNFQFKSDVRGKHELVFSYLGYKTEIIPINLDTPGRTFIHNIDLIADQIELDELVITSSNKEWQDKYKIFFDQFIGRNEYSRNTIILNPWVLNFNRDSAKNLTASTSEPIEIVNNTLGFIIHIELKDFLLEATNFYTTYSFVSRFEEMHSDNPEKVESWKQNREQAYRASFRHFLHSLYHGQLRRNEFEIVRAESKRRISVRELPSREVRRWQNTIKRSHSSFGNNVKAFRFSVPADVLYGEVTHFGIDHRKRSRITPLTEHGKIYISDRGILLNPLDVRVDGNWSVERIANLLPIDYETQIK